MVTCPKCKSYCSEQCDNSCGTGRCPTCKQEVYSHSGVSGTGHNPHCGETCSESEIETVACYKSLRKNCAHV